MNWADVRNKLKEHIKSKYSNNVSHGDRDKLVRFVSRKFKIHENEANKFVCQFMGWIK